MTRVYLERDGDRYLISAEGHARGYPGACAAVSTLMQALEAWIYASGAEVEADTMEPGNAVLCFRGEGCGVAFELVRCGFLRLQSTAPEAVQVTERTL